MKHSNKQSPLVRKQTSEAPASNAEFSGLLPVHLKALRRCRMVLMKDLDPDDVFDLCLPSADLDGTRPHDQRDSTLSKVREDRLAALLDRLENCDEHIFAQFMELLRERYKHLYSLLEETIRTSEDEGREDENIRERAAIAGHVVRELLKIQKRRQQTRRAGSESPCDPSIENLADV